MWVQETKTKASLILFIVYSLQIWSHYTNNPASPTLQGEPGWCASMFYNGSLAAEHTFTIAPKHDLSSLQVMLSSAYTTKTLHTFIDYTASNLRTYGSNFLMQDQRWNMWMLTL